MSQSTTTWQDSWRAFAEEINYRREPCSAGTLGPEKAMAVEQFGAHKICYKTFQGLRLGAVFFAQVFLMTTSDFRFELDPNPTLLSHLFGWQSAHVGDDSFDGSVVVKTNQPEKLDALLKEAHELRTFVALNKFSAYFKPGTPGLTSLDIRNDHLRTIVFQLEAGVFAETLQGLHATQLTMHRTIDLLVRQNFVSSIPCQHPLEDFGF